MYMCKEKVILCTSLNKNITRSCGCLSKEKTVESNILRKKNLIGQRFGRLLVIKEDKKNKNGIKSLVLYYLILSFFDFDK